MPETTLIKAEELLVESILKLKKRGDLKDFLTDLLTPEEMLDLGQRLRIAKLILKGKTYEYIAEKVSVSTTTVSKVAQALKHGEGGLEKALEGKRGDA